MTKSIRKSAIAALVAAGVAVALTGCGAAPEEEPKDDSSSTSEGSETTGTDEAASDFLPCIVSDFGGFDDKSFNQLSKEGADAAADELGVELKDVESNAETEYAPNVETLVAEGCNVVVGVGFALSAAVLDAAAANEDVDFILVDDAADADGDGKVDSDNVKPLLYNTAEAAFLAGYLAAGYTEAGKVGTFGGQEFPTVTIFMDGFKQGVDYYNSEKGTSVEVVGWDGTTGSFTGGFDANQEAKTTAQNVLDQGVDVIFPVGGPIYQSALAAITEAGSDVALIGADADLFETDETTQDYVLTSVLKGMDVSTKEAILASANGEFSSEPYIGTLDNAGVGIADLHNFADKVDAELVAEVDALKESIIAGDVTVKSYLD